MKKSEIIENYREGITGRMTELLKVVYESYGRVQYGVYVWEDGEVEVLEQVQGDHSWLEPKDWEPRELVFVGTVSEPYFDPWDYADQSKPDEDDENYESIIAEVEAEIIDWLMGQSDEYVKDLIDARIEELELMDE